MRVFISVDMEGIAGVVHWADTKLEGVEYERARHWMTGEANASIEGALQAGATEVVVNDSHGHMRNLLAEDLHPDAQLVRGSLKPLSMMQGLEPGFDAAFLVGYHAMAGVGGGILNHTFIGSMVAALRLNGQPVGEVGYNTAVAGAMQVPVVLVTGDDALAHEVQEQLPWAERVVVKHGYTSWSARNVSPQKACELIRDGAQRALQRLDEMRLPQLDPPIRFEAQFFRPVYADLAGFIPGAERIDGTTVAYTAPDMLTVNRAWMTMMNIVLSQPGGYG